MKKVSFVIPCYRSENTLEGVILEIKEAMNKLEKYILNNNPSQTINVKRAYDQLIWKVDQLGNKTHIEQGKGYIFEYNDFEFIKPIKCAIGKHNNHHKTKVKCIEDNLSFNSIKEAGKYYNIRPNNIACCLCNSSKAKTAGGKHWEYDN